MNNVIELAQNIFFITSTKQFFLFTELFTSLILIIFGFLLIKKYIPHTPTHQKHHTFYILLLIIISMLIENLGWILKLSYKLEYIHIDRKIISCFAIASWIANIILYQALGLFIENIVEKIFSFKWNKKIIYLLNGVFISLFTYTSIAHIYEIQTYFSIDTMFRIATIYRYFIIVPSIVIAVQKLYEIDISAILQKQLTIFLNYIIFPLLVLDLLESIPFYGLKGAYAHTHGFIASNRVLFTIIAIIFCAFKLIRFRFFNFSKKVQDTDNQKAINEFKDLIKHLSLATTPNELILITESFLKKNLNIDNENIHLTFRYHQENLKSNSNDITNSIIESFISKENPALKLLQDSRILVADELLFDTYSTTTNENEVILAEFLRNIDAEIFLAMYDKNNIIAYLTIKKSNPHKFYTINEQNKIVIFGDFLASAIKIMHNSNTATLLQENKIVKEELYLKHQEINQYKESLKNLFKQKVNSNVGILFYKDDRFTFGNETAQNLISINLNQQKNHPTTLFIRKLAQQVEAFRSMQSRYMLDNHNKQLMITGIPNLDYQSGIILTLHYSDTSEIIKAQIDKLQNPTQIDYLLYLESTKSGNLINQIIPSNSENLLNFKIQLLEIALSKKAILLHSHQNDLLTIVEIIHHISLRSNLHILELNPTIDTDDIAIKLFGLNPLLQQNSEDGLLKKLNQKGTLYIKNIERLDIETQNKLAYFIRYGIFTVMKSEHKISSDVRIICSIEQNLETLLEENKLSKSLYEELQKTTLIMPSLMTLDKQELEELIDGYAHQIVENNNFSQFLQISKKDKIDLFTKRPASLLDFKNKIQQLLSEKSEEYQIFHETHIN